MLSRVSWPVFATSNVIDRLAAAHETARIRRVCIQALNYPEVATNLLALVETIKQQAADLPISVSYQPANREDLVKLARAGVDSIGIALDAATREIFERVKGSLVKGPYNWDKQREMLLHAVDVFGRGRVTTHLIVGLGETEKEMIRTIQWCTDNNIYTALFSFTPIRGTALEQNQPPHIDHYRRVQVARHLIVTNKSRFERMRFTEYNMIVDFGVSKQLLRDLVQSGSPFKTSGCPDCNRPYYNEKPSGPLYNFPTQPTSKQIKQIEQEIFSPTKHTLNV